MIATLKSTTPQLEELKTRVTEIYDINAAVSVLYWDQSTYMPSGGAGARGRQMALLRQIAHQKLTDPSLGKLLADLQTQEKTWDYSSPEASLIRLTYRNYQRAIQVPGDFVAQFSAHRSRCYEAWAKAKEEDNFALVQAELEKNLDFTRQYANFFSGYDHIADPLIEEVDYGMTTATLRPLFAQLRKELVPLVEAISSCPPLDVSCVQQGFDRQKQLQFTLNLLRQVGYDFYRGRQDESLHPFTTSFSIGDVRITTRVRENDLTEALFSTIHEMGHAFYEQGLDRTLEGTPLAEGTSAGVHESQSRLWENLSGDRQNFGSIFIPNCKKCSQRN